MTPRPPIHPAIADAQSNFHADLVQEVAQAVATNDVVVVGVSGLQPGKKAKRLLDAQKVPRRVIAFNPRFIDAVAQATSSTTLSTAITARWLSSSRGNRRIRPLSLPRGAGFTGTLHVFSRVKV